ncbi:hypothetical protein NDU88_001501 [Pleurodeles waltl]|uniref:Uncharacterized protein n=1 Tax=Pleurodeles waltl TaxID=8319 RepID=A0AAV7LBM2_PLEWA|nr:hypothetical protein NDU88_001501 [Pleurodeles waltl]
MLRCPGLCNCFAAPDLEARWSPAVTLGVVGTGVPRELGALAARTTVHEEPRALGRRSLQAGVESCGPCREVSPEPAAGLLGARARRRPWRGQRTGSDAEPTVRGWC